MGQFLSKFARASLALGLIYFGIWALNQFGVIDTKTLFLQTMSYVPGLSDLSQNYDLGKKRSSLLLQRDAELEAREKMLKAAEEKLAKEQDEFEDEKFEWRKANPYVTPKPAQTSSKYVNTAGILRQRKEDKIQEYLAMVGKMKPSQAAIVLQKLPEQTVFMIFDQLRPSQVTRIMEKLPEDYLAKLTQDRLNKYRNI